MSDDRPALLAEALAQWRAGNVSEELADALVLLDQPRPEPPPRPEVDLRTLTRELLDARVALPPDTSPRALDEALALLPILQPDAGALFADAFSDLAGRTQGNEPRWRTLLESAFHLTGPALDPAPLFPLALQALGHASPRVAAHALRFFLNLPPSGAIPGALLAERLARLPWRRPSPCPLALLAAPTDDADAERLLARLVEDHPERLALALGLLTAARHLPQIPSELRTAAAFRLADPCGLVGDAAAQLLHAGEIGFTAALGLYHSGLDGDALRPDPGARLQTEWRMWGRWARRSSRAGEPPLPPVTGRDDLGVRAAADDARREAALAAPDLVRAALAPPRPRRARAAEPEMPGDAPILLVKPPDRSAAARFADAYRVGADPNLPDRLPAGAHLVFQCAGDARLLLQLRALEALARQAGFPARIAGHRAVPMVRNAAGLWETPPAVVAELEALANLAGEGEILLTPALGARLPSSVPARLLIDHGAPHDLPDPLRWVHALPDVTLQGATRNLYLAHASDTLGRAIVGRPLQRGSWERAAEREEAREKDVLRQTIQVAVFVVGIVLIAGLLSLAWRLTPKNQW